jgi:LacI family transcriptional regulator
LQNNKASSKLYAIAMAEIRPRNITIFDVARASGVSYSTVSRVLNGFEFVKASTRQKVLTTADDLGYVANLQARSLAGGKSQIIGLLVPALDNGYISEISGGIDEELAKANYDLMLYTTHRKQGKESKYVHTIINGPTDGLVLLVPLVPQSYLELLHQQRFPYVLIDQGDTSNQSAVVTSTNYEGAYEATAYLIKLGHKRIGFVAGQEELISSRERLEGYKAALKDNDLSLDESLIVAGDFDQHVSRLATQMLLDLAAPPSAIFACNDLSAFGVMEAVREAGLQIPKDMSVIGFDDIPQSSITYPKLSTVRQPLKEMGKVAVELLLEQINNPEVKPKQITLGTRLMIRDSCQRYS